MRIVTASVVVALTCLIASAIYAADSPSQKASATFGRGINLGNALEAPNEGDWGIRLKEEYFERIAAAGFDSVRIPVRWSAHAAEAPPYTIDAKFFERVDWAVDQALKRKLLVVLNMHHYDGMMTDPAKHRERFIALWKQIAERYKDRPPTLAFELLNEPQNKLTADQWNRDLAAVLAVVRASNPTRDVVIGPVHWNAISDLGGLKLPEADRHLIVTVHYYNPFHFTHQGAEFVPGAKQWLGEKWSGSKAEQQAIVRDFDTAAAWAVNHQRPLYLGEFGSYHKADMESRARWTRFMADEAIKRKMGFAYWEFCSGFGAYDPNKNAWIEPLKNALLGR
jgi:endoglucanase